MGYIKEPKTVDLIVGPSDFTEDIRQSINQAITQYKKTGQKTVNAKSAIQNPTKRSAFVEQK